MVPNKAPYLCDINPFLHTVRMIQRT